MYGYVPPTAPTMQYGMPIAAAPIAAPYGAVYPQQQAFRPAAMPQPTAYGAVPMAMPAIQQPTMVMGGYAAPMPHYTASAMHPQQQYAQPQPYAPQYQPIPQHPMQQQQMHAARQQPAPSPSTSAVDAYGGAAPPVSAGWVKLVATGAAGFDGRNLATCIDFSQLPTFLTLPPSVTSLFENSNKNSKNASSSATMGKGGAAAAASLFSAEEEARLREAAAKELSRFVAWLQSAIAAEVSLIGARTGASESASAAAKRFAEVFVSIAAAVFVLKVAKLFQPPTATSEEEMVGASSGGGGDTLAAAVGSSTSSKSRMKGKKSSSASSSEGKGLSPSVDLTDLTAILDDCTDATRNLYLRALVKAFESLQELHTSKRSPKACNGFPGWDTAVVISFVHVIQNVCQTIGEIEGNTLGDIMRLWRKLFVFLQTSDPDVANENSRRRGALAVANSLLIVFFQQDNTHQCRTILSSIEAAEKNAERDSVGGGAGGSESTTRSIIKSSSHLVAEMVKFRFYQGRIRLFDRNYEGAFAAFSEASRLLPPMPAPKISKKDKTASPAPAGAAETTAAHPLAMGTMPGTATAAEVAASVAAAAPSECPIPSGMNAAQRDNKLRVTFYQITSSILCNLRVPADVLSADPTAAKVFRPIIAAIQNGSPAAFTMAVDLHGAFLRHRGVYMLLQQARIYCYLSLLQQVHAATAAAGKEPSMLPIGVFVEALAAANHACCDPSSEGHLFGPECGETEVVLAEGQQGAEGVPPMTNADVFRLIKKMRVDVDARCELDDAHLWIGRLIARGLVRGYVSYEHKTLVLSQKEPFPAPAYTFPL